MLSDYSNMSPPHSPPRKNARSNRSSPPHSPPNSPPLHGLPPNAQLQNAGVLGAYDRMKRRHQNKYSEQPNPKRAAQKNLRALDQHALDANARRLDKIDLEALSGILARANGGHRLHEDEVLSIFIQCDPDGYGFIKSKRIVDALSLFERNREYYEKMAHEGQPGCQCVIS
ncbi:hypothetical protein DUNSADRAFT_15403 [Dunaliella salina]|uniref:EF-hand domain-containing protein n=1 Tax=Dunaliella salina TaxID=3046 RepID=A0ABQ7G5I5_DUNSA|nr:hypothetical protein DUNSADRAFT_15403 [Dunaliella salina]|eukprot:KAF5829866.1 hypothetical protein DUNSADRAFT_15403 [Dunaliella salina]